MCNNVHIELQNKFLFNSMCHYEGKNIQHREYQVQQMLRLANNEGETLYSMLSIMHIEVSLFDLRSVRCKI